MHNQLINQVKQIGSLKYIFCDYYDTVVHRTAHPLQAFKIWAMQMKRELGMELSVNDLYKIRRASMKYLSKKSGLFESELSYDKVMQEIYTRLVSTNALDSQIPVSTFIKYSSESDFRSESSIQCLNKKMVDTLQSLKDHGYKIFCVSDFHFDEQVIERLIKFHGIENLYDCVYVSSSQNTSKESKGTLYKTILEKENISPTEVFMIGDNHQSDYVYAKLHGIEAYHIKNATEKIKHKFHLLGSDKKDYKKALKKVKKDLRSIDHPYAEYLIILHVFVERLYAKAKQDGIKNLFFLAREGLFLKRLFDKYQEIYVPGFDNQIKTHYLKMSRQAAIQISYKPLEKENFSYLPSQYHTFSLRQFFKSFLFKEVVILELAENVGVKPDDLISNFFDSEIYHKLIKDAKFQELYESNRITQKENFDRYLASFNVDFNDEDMHVIDVGWGGTMQECLYDYFKGETRVFGYYVGLQEIYNITKDTKRMGFLFSVHPFNESENGILMANRQIFEQFLAAPHGSTLAYSSRDDFTVEYFKEEERFVFEKFIFNIQEFMFDKYDNLLEALQPLAYDDKIVSDYILKLKMKLDLFSNRSQNAFLDDLSKGFYQNVGNNNVGLNYEFKELGFTPLQALKHLILRPEEMFRYVIKIKLLMYRKKVYFLSWPVNLFYYYIKFYKFLKNKVFKRQLTD